MGTVKQTGPPSPSQLEADIAAELLGASWLQDERVTSLFPQLFCSMSYSFPTFRLQLNSEFVLLAFHRRFKGSEYSFCTVNAV